MMSQPQPAPYYPPPPKKSSTGIILLVVILAVVLVGGVAAYAGYQIYRASPRNGGPTPSGTNTIDISGNSLTETVPVSSDSTVDMSCNYCTVTLQLSASTVTANLDLSGNSNQVTIAGGQTNISVSGNYNVVNALQTTVLSVQNSGNGNTIQR